MKTKSSNKSNQKMKLDCKNFRIKYGTASEEGGYPPNEDFYCDVNPCKWYVEDPYLQKSLQVVCDIKTEDHVMYIKNGSSFYMGIEVEDGGLICFMGIDGEVFFKETNLTELILILSDLNRYIPDLESHGFVIGI